VRAARSKGGPCLVVGYDGSEPARAAVTYAAERAGRRGRLFIVHATGSLAHWMGAPSEQVVTGDREGHGRALLDELLLEAGNVLLDSDFELELASGSAPDALVEVARAHDADEIVLGTRGQGRVGSLLGSVAQEVLHLADRPVVVIPYNAVREHAEAQG